MEIKQELEALLKREVTVTPINFNGQSGYIVEYFNYTDRNSASKLFSKTELGAMENLLLHLKDNKDSGGIWVTSTLSNAKKLKKYFEERYKKARIFECEIGEILYQNAYRTKTDKVRLMKEEMKTLKKETLKTILKQIVSEDPYCGIEGEDKALNDLIKYLEENNINVE